MKPSRSSLFFWLWLLLLLILNLIPTRGTILTGERKISAGFRFDYLTHFLAFLFPPLIYRHIRYHGGYLFRHNQFFTAFVISGICAMSFEYIQYFLPYRTFNPNDLFFNLAGVIIGFTVVGISESSKNRTCWRSNNVIR